MSCVSRLVACGLLLVASFGVCAADDAPAFDRPGISFSTQTLPRGGFAWEQGLPDASYDESGGVRTTTWVADTNLRLGLSDSLEVQLGADSYGGMRQRGRGIRSDERGGGDGRIGLKWVPATGNKTFSWGMLATATLPFGEAPLGDGGHDFDLGAAASWTLPRDASVSLYLDRSWAEGGGWLFSPNYGFALSDTVGAYVEAGFGSGTQRQRVAGGGVTWMATPRVQLDASFLRGLDASSPDWQAGIGLSVYFAPRR